MCRRLRLRHLDGDLQDCDAHLSGGEVPTVDDAGTCYTGACAPATECATLATCAACTGADQVCVTYQTQRGNQLHCVTLPPACGANFTCDCLGPTACVAPYRILRQPLRAQGHHLQLPELLGSEHGGSEAAAHRYGRAAAQLHAVDRGAAARVRAGRARLHPPEAAHRGPRGAAHRAARISPDACRGRVLRRGRRPTSRCSTTSSPSTTATTRSKRTCPSTFRRRRLIERGGTPWRPLPAVTAADLLARAAAAR